MFKLDARTDYALVLCVFLAKQKKGPVPVKLLASRLSLSSSYFSQIAKPLLTAGIIKSKEGLGGGYSLAKKASEIKILDILEALNKDEELRCYHKKGTCAHFQECLIKNHWPGIIQEMKQVLAKKKLSSLL